MAATTTTTTMHDDDGNEYDDDDNDGDNDDHDFYGHDEFIMAYKGLRHYITHIRLRLLEPGVCYRYPDGFNLLTHRLHNK